MDQSEDKSAAVSCTHAKLGDIGRNSKERCNSEDSSPKVGDSSDRCCFAEECIVRAAAACIGPQVVAERVEMTGCSMTSQVAPCRHAFAYCSHLRPSADPPSSS